MGKEEGVIVTLIDGDSVGVVNAVVGSGLGVNVKLTDGEPVGVS